MSATETVGVLSRSAGRRHLLDLVELTKPKIALLVLVTTAAGFCLGSPPGTLDVAALAHVLAGIFLVAGGASGFNMILERASDRLMTRTAGRPVAAGRLRVGEAVLFSSASMAVGALWLLIFSGAVCAALAAASGLWYAFVYTQAKSRTPLHTIIGAVCGALPPAIGWAAASGGIGTGGWLLFAVQFAWQVPHFFAISLIYRDQYRAAGTALLPVAAEGSAVTERQTLVYTGVMVGVSLLPAAAGMAGIEYVVVAALLGVLFASCAAWMVACSLSGAAGRTRRAARLLFVVSILYLPLLFAGLFATRI